MIVYEVRFSSATCIFDNLDDAADEVYSLMEHIDEKEEAEVVIAKRKMTKERFEALPEFEGY